jgi:CheY-like chemotaxis protein
MARCHKPDFILMDIMMPKMDADGYMTKPFSQQDLLDTIDRFLRSPT